MFKEAMVKDDKKRGYEGQRERRMCEVEVKGTQLANFAESKHYLSQ